MDKRTATLTLTEKLRKIGYVNLIADPAVKTYLLNASKHKVLDSGKGRIRTFCLSNIDIAEFENEIVSRIPHSLEHIFPQANYFFLERGIKSSPYGDWQNALITPAALIGEIEERVLREKFYKDITDETAEALEVLKIHNFIKEYKVYSSLSDFKHVFFTYTPFEVGMAVEVGDIIQGQSTKKYYLVEEINGDYIKGHKFNDSQLEHACEEDKYGDCCNEKMIPIKKRTINMDFLNFVFDIPYEDQNIGANKAILRDYAKSTDICSILTKEYHQGKYFQEHFEVLDEESRKKVVDKIKILQVQNKFLNSWMFHRGFDVQMDYLDLYKNDAKGFIAYFVRGDKPLQELIVSDLFESEYANQEVIEFLEKKYSHLLRDVSFKN